MVCYIDILIKLIGSFGRFEEIVVELVVMIGEVFLIVMLLGVFVFVGDYGIVKEGVLVYL